MKLSPCIAVLCVVTVVHGQVRGGARGSAEHTTSPVPSPTKEVLSGGLETSLPTLAPSTTFEPSGGPSKALSGAPSEEGSTDDLGLDPPSPLPKPEPTAKALTCNLVAGDSTGAPNKPLFDPCSAGTPKFHETILNVLTPSFMYKRDPTVIGCSGFVKTGLMNAAGDMLETPIYGYKEGPDAVCSSPGMTFVASSNRPLHVDWQNDIKKGSYLLTSMFGESVVDTSLHWAYSLHGYDHYNTRDGVPMITHVHGVHAEYQSDGNSDAFFSPNKKIVGPAWTNGTVPQFVYDNPQPAALNWYHDHTLGLTRLNAYSGMAGFYFIRDDFDTGEPDNPLTLPVYPFETALVIQDRMFKPNGELFYPAFPGDPAYADFITGEGAGELPYPPIPNPTALAEFFGDFMLVNSKIWPKMVVRRRHYRLRLLNACDSRFLIIRFCLADSEDPTEFPGGPGSPACIDDDAIPFYVIGSDLGLRFHGLPKAPNFKTLVVEPGARYDIVINFGMEGLSSNKRVIMANLGPDAPFGGNFDDPPVKVDTYLFTDRIMAFDVGKRVDHGDYFNTTDFNDALTDYDLGRVRPRRIPEPDTPTRSVGLFEGLDAFGRLQPLLGTVYPATDASGAAINWPNQPQQPYIEDGRAGQQMQGTMGLHEPTTEFPVNGTTEYWDIWNLSVDAHPVHLHLVSMEIVARFELVWNGGETARICKDGNWIPNDDDPNKDNYPDCDVGRGTYLVPQPNAQHDGSINLWGGRRVVNPTMGATVTKPSEYFENGPKDMVIALPNQVTRIKATFDKVGRYAWHCHLLSHEDHEMMRVMEVVPQPDSSTL